jgi:MscS family membrane protein
MHAPFSAPHLVFYFSLHRCALDDHGQSSLKTVLCYSLYHKETKKQLWIDLGSKGALMSDLMRHVLLGRPAAQWLLAAAFIAGGFVVGHICSGIASVILKRFCAKTKSKVDDLIAAELRLPLVVILTLVGVRLGLNCLGISPGLSLWAGRFLKIALVLMIALALNRISGAVIIRHASGKAAHPLLNGDISLQPVLRKFFAVLVWIVAAVLVLQVLGYNISALLAGLGLGGAALALASKDTLSNFFGSLMVFLDKPFRINDRIRIGDYDGVITEIGLRTSRLRTLENRVVVIPNSLFTATPIENVSSAPNTKVAQTIKVHGDNGPEKIGRALELLGNIQASGLDGRCVAGLTSIGNIVCQISLVFFVARDADYWQTVNGVNLEILKQFKEAGIRLI